MASVDRNLEMSVAGWTVRGTLQTGGRESVLGGAKYKFKAPKGDAWLPRTTKLPAKVQEQISLTKDKIKQILRARLAQAVAKGAKAGTKAAKPKALVKKTLKKAAKKPAAKKCCKPEHIVPGGQPSPNRNEPDIVEVSTPGVEAARVSSSVYPRPAAPLDVEAVFNVMSTLDFYGLQDVSVLHGNDLWCIAGKFFLLRSASASTPAAGGSPALLAYCDGGSTWEPFHSLIQQHLSTPAPPGFGVFDWLASPEYSHTIL